MTKNVFHAIMTKEQRSIRHVPLPHHRKGGGVAEEDSILYEREEVEIEESHPAPWRRLVLWSAAGLFLILLGIALATSFTGATVTVTPKAQVVTVKHDFVASRIDGAK